MTATPLTYLIAQQKINDLIRDAERSRRAAGAGSSRRVRWSIPRVLTRRVARAAIA